MKIAMRAVFPLAVAASPGINRTTDQLQMKPDHTTEHTQLQINGDGDDELVESSFIQTNTVGVPDHTESLFSDHTRSHSEGQHFEGIKETQQGNIDTRNIPSNEGSEAVAQNLRLGNFGENFMKKRSNWLFLNVFS